MFIFDQNIYVILIRSLLRILCDEILYFKKV